MSTCPIRLSLIIVDREPFRRITALLGRSKSCNGSCRFVSRLEPLPQLSFCAANREPNGKGVAQGLPRQVFVLPKIIARLDAAKYADNR